MDISGNEYGPTYASSFHSANLVNSPGASNVTDIVIAPECLNGSIRGMTYQFAAVDDTCYTCVIGEI